MTKPFHSILTEKNYQSTGYYLKPKQEAAAAAEAALPSASATFVSCNTQRAYVKQNKP